KTSSIDVRPLADWFVPFNIGARVHPYAVELNGRDQPDLFDLTQSDNDGHHLTRGVALTEMPETVDGLDPVSDLVAAARRDARTPPTPRCANAGTPPSPRRRMDPERPVGLHAVRRGA